MIDTGLEAGQAKCCWLSVTGIEAVWAVDLTMCCQSGWNDSCSARCTRAIADGKTGEVSLRPGLNGPHLTMFPSPWFPSSAVHPTGDPTEGDRHVQAKISLGISISRVYDAGEK